LLFFLLLILIGYIPEARMSEASPSPHKPTTLVLGPFVGNITRSSVRIWLNVEVGDSDKNVFVTLKLRKVAPPSDAARKDLNKVEIRTLPNPVLVKSAVITCLKADMGTGVVNIQNLDPNSEYSYQLWEDPGHSVPLDLRKLDPSDLFFWTLPEDGYGRQLDFLLMSCHNPETKKDDGFHGFGVWHQIPEIIDVEQNANVRFAILTGDQVYADEVEVKVLNERDARKRKELYLSIYKKFWDNVCYRKVLCRVPAVLMWDDHDITDGWGSREDSYDPKHPHEFTGAWLDLFDTAKEMFRIMQASRNPDPLSKNFETGFDTCFTVGKAGFVVADLRSNRNVRKHQMWKCEQLEAIKAWVAKNKSELHTLFFISSVVFSHGDPKIEGWILKIWFPVLNLVKWIERIRLLKRPVDWFNTQFGDLRDDINDSWGSDPNKEEADRVLDFLFALQNPTPAEGLRPPAEKPLSPVEKSLPPAEKPPPPAEKLPPAEKPLNVVILSGDIHTPGYSTIYSSSPQHKKKAVIPHIVATPVAYAPFSWIGEAVFRHATKVVKLGTKGRYTSQISHHFCYRNVVVVSLRNYETDESHLKVKYYLEGFPEPQVMLFDLNHGSHREDIGWPETIDPESPADKLLFGRKDKQDDASRKSISEDIPITPLGLP
jgi:hypothetical protein